MQASLQQEFTPFKDVVEPKWEADSPVLDESAYVVNGDDFRVAGQPLAPSDALREKLQQVFDDTGLIHITNTGLDDYGVMRDIASLVMKNLRSYEGGANPRRPLQKNVYEVGAPLEAWLHYHHEMAYIGSSTKMIGFMARHMPAQGGYTYVSDNCKVTDALLATPFGQKLKEKGVCYHRDLTDRNQFTNRQEIGVYNHWQRSMMTEYPKEAIAEARARGLEAEWGDNGLLKTRFTISAFEYYPHLDRNLLYSSIADDAAWFDTWPLVHHLPDDERPLKLTFGDGTELTDEEKTFFTNIYGDYGMPIKWSEGDIALICNYRFAHGRPAIHLKEGEQREIGVLIGESFVRQETLPEKW